MNPYFLASRENRSQNTEVCLGISEGEKIIIGGGRPVIIAGPCAVESAESAVDLALQLKKLGVRVLRSMIFKPRTSPYSFQGLDWSGIPVLKEIKNKTDMILVTEVRELKEAEAVAPYADVFQIGTRNMTNFNLLREIASFNKPVILKRGMGATIEEWLCAAEYILAQGNYKVILCERGIRTFETYTRFTLDISAVPSIKELSHLPVIIDPSHASGKSSLVIPLAKAGLAAGADGVLVEVHQNPPLSKSDSFQAITPAQLTEIL